MRPRMTREWGCRPTCGAATSIHPRPRPTDEVNVGHHSSRELESASYHYLDITNEHPKPFVWTKTADATLWHCP